MSKYANLRRLVELHTEEAEKHFEDSELESARYHQGVANGLELALTALEDESFSGFNPPDYNDHEPLE